MPITFDEDKQKRKLGDLLHKEEEDLVQLLTTKYGVDYVNLTVVSVNADALRLIDETTARAAQVAAFALIDKKIKIAARNPEDEKVRAVTDTLKIKGYNPELYIASTQSLEKAWKTYKDLSFAFESKAGSLEISGEEIAAFIDKVKSLPTIVSILENTLAAKKSYRVSRILETIVAGALAVNASDIHLEPEETYIRLRYRLDGVLQDVIKFDPETYGLVLSRIKLISGMKLNVKKDSQDGRFSIRLATGDIEVRVSILPGAYNESIVMRLLNPKAINVALESLGINEKLLAILVKEMNRPDGMILTTGPTGSGKTTTLYAFIKKIHTPDIKIITIEDPIEYHLPGIVQTQTNDKGYNFTEGLRAAVRQDPDIIMVGEIRDHETADIAINSALTGHLVFSTLHTNDAAGTFPRLIDLGVNSKVITSAIRVAMAQRLTRRLCPDCKKEVVLEGATKAIIEAILNEIEDKSLIPAERGKMWVAVGCDKCNHTGYRGRVGVYEAILTDEKVENAVEMNPSEREIWAAAKGQGILTMKQDGIVKILQGMTSLEELQRVIAFDD
ncbi:MAG: type pilus assembly protein PilB [Candidatus Parcubacteria bacterium]|jgi:type IV pilus assembly protein PilB|nr:type pilus assembly protein PilB [Candidatus Parcubacteria bacterium]